MWGLVSSGVGLSYWGQIIPWPKDSIIYISVCGGVGVGGGLFLFCFVCSFGWLVFVVVAVVVVGFVLPKIVFTVFAIRFSWPNK